MQLVLNKSAKLGNPKQLSMILKYQTISAPPFFEGARLEYEGRNKQAKQTSLFEAGNQPAASNQSQSVSAPQIQTAEAAEPRAQALEVGERFRIPNEENQDIFEVLPAGQYQPKNFYKIKNERTGETLDKPFKQSDIARLERVEEASPISSPIEEIKQPSSPTVGDESKNEVPQINSYDDFKNFARVVQSGDITPDELQQSFEYVLDNEKRIKENLAKFTIAELKKRFTSWHSKTKADWIDSGFSSMVKFHLLDKNYVISGFETGAKWKEKETEAIRAAVESNTAQDIADYAASVKKRQDERAELLAKVEKAIANPETLEDFEKFFRYKSYSDLTDAQKRNYETLVADKAREDRKAAKAKTSTVESVELEDVDLTISKHLHTKHNKDIWIVSMSDRVPADKYQELNSKAKMLGGRYQREWKPTKTPAGFQFFSEDSANDFVALLEGDVDRTGELQRRAERRQMTTLERLREAAENLETSATENLNKDRLENTARRAGMAANQKERSRREIAFAGTMANIADAIESGEIKYLEEIHAKTQFETLERLLRQGKASTEFEKQKLAREENGYYQANFDREPTDSDIDNVKFPYPVIREYDYQTLKKIGQTIDGVKLLARRIAKRTAPGKSITNQTAIDEVRELAGKLKYAKGLDAEILQRNLSDDLASYNRLNAIGINNPQSLKAALREYLPFRVEAEQESELAKLERELVGTKYGRENDYFPTPPELARRLAETADIREGMSVLEPSAGKGNILDAVREVAPDAEIDAIEMLDKLRKIVKLKGFSLVESDFLDYETDKRYDRVVMNPPFKDEIDHIKKAYELLKDGGRLVAITSPSWTYNKSKDAQGFREWIEDVGGYAEDLPEGSFSRGEVSTNVHTKLLVIDKAQTAKQLRIAAKETDAEYAQLLA